MSGYDWKTVADSTHDLSYPIRSSINSSSQNSARSSSRSPSMFPIYYLTAISCIGGFLFGYDTGVVSGALVLIGDDFDLTDLQKELIVGVTVAGALTSSVFAGSLSDRFGRVPVILFSSVVFVVGAIVMAVANGYTALIIGRFIVGLGVGAASMSMPVYVGEAAPSDIRGFLVTCINVAITFGQFFSSCIDGAFATVDNGWRYMLGFAAIPAFMQLVGFCFLPESPRWLLENDYVDTATSALRRLRDTPDVQQEVQHILESIQTQRDQDRAYFGTDKFSIVMTIKKLLFETKTKRALILGSMLQAAQQFCGINTVMYYSATILKLAGFTTTTEALWLSAAVSFCNFAGSGIGLYLVERLGRRRLTLTSLAGVTVCLALLSVSFYLTEVSSDKSESNPFGDSCGSNDYCFDCVQSTDCGFCTHIPIGFNAFTSGCIQADDGSPKNASQCASTSDFYSDSCPKGGDYGWMVFATLCLYLFAFAPGMGTMPWCINSEIFPTAVRGAGNSVTTSVNWTSNLIMSLTFLTITNALTKQGAFALYSGVAFLFFVYFYQYLPETRGLALEDIVALFGDQYYGKAYRTVGKGSGGSGGSSLSDGKAHHGASDFVYSQLTGKE